MDNETYERIVKNVVLPDWVKEFDDPETRLRCRIIKYNDAAQTFQVFDGDPIVPGETVDPEGDFGAPIAQFDTIVEAYDSIEPADFSTILHPNVNGRGGSFDFDETMFFCDSEEGRETFRVLLSNKENLSYSVLAYTYHEWTQNAAPAYHADPASWLTSFEFVKKHPAFWRRADVRNTKVRLDAYDWETDIGDEWLHTSISTNKAGEIRVWLDTGAHIPSDQYRTRYADYRLEVSGSDLNDAYVQLAAALSANFNDDGTDKGLKLDLDSIEDDEFDN